MYEAIAEYGTTGLTWLLLGMGALLLRYVFPLVKNAWAHGVLERAWVEVKAAVLEVGQTYTGALKAAALDGKLTDAEKAEAKLLALNIAKLNIGSKGLKRLARILDLDVGKWIGSKTEVAVALANAATAKPAADVSAPPDPSGR